MAPRPRVQKKPAGIRLSATPQLQKNDKSMVATLSSSKGSSVSARLLSLKAFVVNLERRPDRWERVSKMLKKQTPWLDFERFVASDGAHDQIPDEEVTSVWNTSCNAHFADFYEWVFAHDDKMEGVQWKWACEATSDELWQFTENLHNGKAWNIDLAGEKAERSGTVIKRDSNEMFSVRLQFAEQYRNPGVALRLSEGERGCAYSHLRLWKIAAERFAPTLVFEDDVQMVFRRNGRKLGKSNGEIFTERLTRALQHAPHDFDVIYLRWAGWRGGHSRYWKKDVGEDAIPKRILRKAEYVWTTVAYVISQQGARKLLAAAHPLNQPVDNFMAWEASQGRLNAYVVLDEGDDDGVWSGGIVDQHDFQGDSDIQKSDGGHQGDDEKQFAVQTQ